MTLHEIEDLARYEREDTPRYRALMRLYTRKLNAEWQRSIRMADQPDSDRAVYHAHEARRPHYARGSDPFRARTIARNACIAVQQALLWHPRGRARYAGEGQREVDAPDAAALAVKAARALRKVRPDLFEGYQGETQYGGEVG